MHRIPGGVPGLVSACDIAFENGKPAAKVVFFESRKALRVFYNTILPAYRGCEQITISPLHRRCAGFVHRLSVTWTHHDGSDPVEEVDRRYFCIVGLICGKLTAEILSHEAMHVGFSWDFRTRGQSQFTDPHNFEENCCYVAGKFVDRVITFIKAEGLREI